MCICHQQSTGQSHTDVISKCVRVEIFGMIATHTCIHEEMKGRLNTGNACYCSCNDLTSHLLSKNKKIKIHCICICRWNL